MEKSKTENKAIKPDEKGIENKQIFSFPEYGQSIEATSQEEANKLLADKLKETK